MSDLVYLRVEQEFLDVMGEPWRASKDHQAMNLREVLVHTVRRCPVRTAGDAERSYQLLVTLRDAEDGVIVMSREDYTWMMEHFRAMAYQVWLAPDSAYLLHYLQTHVTSQQPPGKAGVDAVSVVTEYNPNERD